MPKLFQINVTANSGSTGKIAEQIGLLAMQQGWEVYLAHGARYVRPSQLKTIQTQTTIDEYKHALVDSLLLDRHGLGSIAATRKLVAQLKEIKPDIVQIHVLHDYYLNYKILFEYLNTTNIPVVWTFHDCWTFTGHCAHFVTANCNRWQTQCHDCPLRKEYPRSLFLDNSKNNYQLKKKLFTGNTNLHIVPVSQWMESMVRQSFLKDKDIQLIHNGIDLSVFRITKQRKTEGVFKIISVSTIWRKSKGLYDFYELRKRLPQQKYEITLVGLTPKQIKQLPEGIQGIERTNSVEELVDLYNSANVLLNLSYADTFPTINLESLACGTPVITYATGGSPEIISDHNGEQENGITTYPTGIVVERQGDIDGLVKAIDKMQEKCGSKIRTLCRERAEQQFNSTTCFKKYIHLYDKLLSHLAP